jgi:hypothetical protein
MHASVVERESARLITVRLSGRLTQRQWEAALQEIANLLKAGERSSLLVVAEDFEGWGAGDWDDMSFQRAHDEQIDRMAIVAEKKWEDQALMFCGKGLRGIEIEFFPPVEIARARQWAVSSS